MSALLNRWGWEVLYHPPPPYSPDISPCDYALIPKMPMRYRTIEDVKQASERSLRTISRLGSANGIQRLLRRCTQRWGLHRGPMTLGTILVSYFSSYNIGAKTKKPTYVHSG